MPVGIQKSGRNILFLYASLHCCVSKRLRRLPVHGHCYLSIGVIILLVMVFTVGLGFSIIFTPITTGTE